MKNNKKSKQSSNLISNNKNNIFNTNQTSVRQNTLVNSNNINQVLAPSLKPHTLTQKIFNKPRPTRPYERFIPTKIALTGVDPSGTIKDFISNDIIAPLKREDIYYQTFTSENIDNSKNKESFKRWALNTTARCNDYKSLPKLQPFTSYYFPPKYNNKDIDNYRKFSLKTDHIGIQVPRCEKVSPDKSFVKLKSDFDFNIETKKENEWVPFTAKHSTNNVSSKNYNIINFRPIFTKNTGMHLLNRTLHFKKKGIGEFADLTKTFRVNVNKEFCNKFRDNPLRFRKYNGIFSDMYDSSHKNGNIIQPFGKK